MKLNIPMKDVCSDVSIEVSYTVAYEDISFAGRPQFTCSHCRHKHRQGHAPVGEKRRVVTITDIRIDETSIPIDPNLNWNFAGKVVKLAKEQLESGQEWCQKCIKEQDKKEKSSIQV